MGFEMERLVKNKEMSRMSISSQRKRKLNDIETQIREVGSYRPWEFICLQDDGVDALTGEARSCI